MGAEASFQDPVDGTTWRVDLDFVASNWTCIWDRGCPGILDRPAAELQQGCCSVGAELLDDDEARRVEALGLTLDPARFQHHAEAAAGGVLSDGGAAGGGRSSTRVVDGACIFLNRPGFDGGVGCALHLAAVDEGESAVEWKPSVCWQLPLKVDEVGEGVRHLRRWQRSDWGEGGQEMAWCCTEPSGPGEAAADGLPTAYIGRAPVAETLAQELQALVGPEVAVAIRSAVARRRGEP